MSAPADGPRFATTLPAGFARNAANDMVRHQSTRAPMLAGYALVLALVVLGAVTRVWPAVFLGLVLAAVAAVLPWRRAGAVARALTRAGLVDGQELTAEYAPTAVTVRGADRSGSVPYDQVWTVRRYTHLVELELRDESVRHVLPAELVPAVMQPRFTVAANRRRGRRAARPRG